MGASRPDAQGSRSAPRLSLLPLPGPLAPVALLTLLAAAPVSAQELARPRLEGLVLKGDSAVPSATVVLHRVTQESAGEIDTVQAGPGGTFAFDLPSVPDPGTRGEVYFASVEHLGILYFGPAVHRPVQLDSVYRIQVRDTAVAPAGGAELPLTMRYLILEPGEDVWQVTDLLQLQNPGDRSLVASEGGVVWRYPLPAGAGDLELGGGDLDPDAVRLSGGELVVSTPIPPGERQYVVRYRLDERRLELDLPGRIHAVELLVREPAPPLTVEGLEATAPVEMEPGTTYRRFSATELQDARVVVRPGRGGGGPRMEWLAVALALVLAGAGLWAVLLRQPSAAPAGGGAAPGATASAGDARERLLLEVAELDERLAGAALAPEEEEELRARRQALVERLRRPG